MTGASDSAFYDEGLHANRILDVLKVGIVEKVFEIDACSLSDSTIRSIWLSHLDHQVADPARV